MFTALYARMYFFGANKWFNIVTNAILIRLKRAYKSFNRKSNYLAVYNFTAIFYTAVFVNRSKDMRM